MIQEPKRVPASNSNLGSVLTDQPEHIGSVSYRRIAFESSDPLPLPKTRTGEDSSAMSSAIPNLDAFEHGPFAFFSTLRSNHQ